MSLIGLAITILLPIILITYLLVKNITLTNKNSKLEGLYTNNLIYKGNF